MDSNASTKSIGGLKFVFLNILVLNIVSERKLLMRIELIGKFFPANLDAISNAIPPNLPIKKEFLNQFSFHYLLFHLSLLLESEKFLPSKSLINIYCLLTPYLAVKRHYTPLFLKELTTNSAF